MTSKQRFYYRVSMQRMYICVCLGDISVFIYLYIICINVQIYIQAWTHIAFPFLLKKTTKKHCWNNFHK